MYQEEKAKATNLTKSQRPTARELGITIGRYPAGEFNAITDVKGVKVGHVTHMQDDVPVADTIEKSCVRCGITAILPAPGNIYQRQLVAGGFILNGIGEVTGFSQLIEWGWLETPILLTNTMSIGAVHKGMIRHMIKRNPELGVKTGVLIPVVGETDDSYLNDVRIPSVTEDDVPLVLQNVKSGYVEQGSIGAGTGMTTLDFAGGIGTSSRVLPKEKGGYTIGVLVLSNFGSMVNFTISGTVIGKHLDRLYLRENRRIDNYGSIIVVVATDAPLLSSQLSKIAKRAALGVGRAGSYAASSSGEIMLAFSTGNRIEADADKKGLLTLNFISDVNINPLYEAVIEATEEAILNAMFCSAGIKGRLSHYSPPLPVDMIQKFMKNNNN